jgi:Asp-tRNA(Asn)/Glu-tRNA(Gln) amidotransferase A subunit family amidase
MSVRKDPSREEKFRILLLNAMTRPMAAAVVALTIIVALNIGYWFFAVGALFYALIVYTSLQDARESKRVLNEVLYPERARKLDLNKLQGSYRTAMQKALETRGRIERAVEETSDPGIKKALASSTEDLEELTATIYNIALKAQSLQGSLQTSNVDVHKLSDEIKRLERVIDTTGDDFARGQYQSALDGKRQQLQNYRDTNDALNRWHAQLDNALSTLDTILSQVLRIRSSEVLSLSAATDEVSHSLRDEVEALKATSDALDTVYGLSR